MSFRSALVGSLVLLSLFWVGVCECDFNFLPMPHNCTVTASAEPLVIKDPCSILYKLTNVSSDGKKHVVELLNHYQRKSYNCSVANVESSAVMSTSSFEYQAEIQIVDSTLRSAFTLEEESYELNATKEGAVLSSKTYVGFVRALETFTQLFQCHRFRTKLDKKACNLTRLPIHVSDQPEFVYRGVMIDTSRHYLPFHMILETVDALMYNKMNVLHWHIVDEDSFPLLLEKHPEIAQYGAFSDEEVYTAAQAREVVSYAMLRGVRVIPELDTPGHAASWGKAPVNKDFACTFGRGYMGPLDVTMEGTYKLVREVFEEINDIFPDPIVHFGGDEVSLSCLKNRSEVTLKDKIENNPQAFELGYRRKQHKIMGEINKNKTPMYWMNSGNMQIEETDIVHWWGNGLPSTTRKIVISYYGPYYLDMGVGNYLGSGYGSYLTWMDLYHHNPKEEIRNYANKDNVLGAEVCLWSEMSNRYTHHQKIWIRSSSIAERLWNSNIKDVKPGALRRITAFERTLHRRGIPTAPATCQQCETSAQFC